MTDQPRIRNPHTGALYAILAALRALILIQPRQRALDEALSLSARAALEELQTLGINDAVFNAYIDAFHRIDSNAVRWLPALREVAAEPQEPAKRPARELH